jgi:predicted metalloprotease with PDZ domain
MPISYCLTLLDPYAHIYQVTCEVNIDKAQPINFSLPDWIPGSYMIREFSKNITEMYAFSNNKKITITQLGKSQWQVDADQGTLKIVSHHYAFDYSVRTCFFDQNHAYFNGTSLFFDLTKNQGVDATEHFLTLEKNSKNIFDDWIVATSLNKKETDSQGFGLYHANSYQCLIDHPVEIAKQNKARFMANGILHEVYIQGKHNTDINKLCNHLKTICEYELNLFEQPYPIDRYVFLFWVMEEGYGGLEHKFSTSLMVSRQDLINTADKNSDEYISLLGLCSHEYFHTWNVKRLKPKAYVDMNLNQEAYTRLLWWFEGVTSYFDDLILLKSGLITLDEYLTLVSKTFNRVLPHTGRKKQSIADSSLTTWNKFYKQDENAQNAIVSYYAKGSMVALALDLTIQQKSEQRYSLKDLLLHLWKHNGVNENGIDEFEIETVLKTHFKLNLANFFKDYIYATQEPDYQNLLNDIGIQLKQENKDDITIGAMIKNDNGLCQLSRVFENQAAMQAGLTANDTIVAIDGIKAKHSNWQKLLNQCANKQTVTVHAFRKDELFKTQLNLTAKASPYILSSIKTPSDKQQNNQKYWLK